jgi:hypothetical protein
MPDDLDNIHGGTTSPMQQDTPAGSAHQTLEVENPPSFREPFGTEYGKPRQSNTQGGARRRNGRNLSLGKSMQYVSQSRVPTASGIQPKVAAREQLERRQAELRS